MTSWRFDRALDTALAACVAESGEALDVPERPPPRTAWVHERRYGLMRESVAAEWGYHAPPDPRRQR